MRIKELNIIKFGSIRDMNIKVQDKMNFLYGFNEADKTAVVDFIIIMLYGTVNNYREDIRQKYLPDDGSDISGSLIFEHNNQTFTLERIFDSGRHRKDMIRLINNTKDTIEDLPYYIKPGEYVFNVDKQIFWRNAYINESAGVSMMQTSHTKIMSAMLSNLISTASERTSVSEVAKCLNSYCDSHNSNSPAYCLNEKKEELEALKEELKTAQETEYKKLSLQGNCTDLQKKFNTENKKYEKIKTGLEIQDILTEIESLENSISDPNSFMNTSGRFNELKSVLKKNRIDNHRKEFDRANEKYKRIKYLRIERDAEISKMKTLNVDLGRYTPKGDSESLQSLIDNQKMIEQTQNNIITLNNQLAEKQDERMRVHEMVSEARFNLEIAEQELTRHEEMSNMKIAQAEDRLHGSGKDIEYQPVKKSKNLILASVVLFILLAALVMFISNIPVVIILCIGIITCLYMIINKIGKEKKVQKFSRVDENELRSNELALRNLRNQISSDRDKYTSKIAFAKNQLKDAQKKENELKHHLEALKKEIEEAQIKREQYMNMKSESEKNVTNPDPKFYSIRSEIAEAERKIAAKEKEISEISNDMIFDLSPICEFTSPDEAGRFIETNLEILTECDSLSDKLTVLGDREKSETAKIQNEQKIMLLRQKLNTLSGGKEIKRLTDQEYAELKKINLSLLEETSKIKDEYINAITALKIQYNDSVCCAVLEEKISKLEKEISETEEQIHSVKIAIDAYNDTLYEIREKYAPSVAVRTSEILSDLTKGKYSSISIKGGRIVIKDKDKNPVNFETISKSTCDQIYFSLRMAVSEVTAGEMHYPVILDDIFQRFNETKASQLLKFLIKYAENSQILIFSNKDQISNLISMDSLSTDNLNMISYTD